MARRTRDACLTCGRASPRGRPHTCAPADVETLTRYRDRNDAALARAGGFPDGLNLPADSLGVRESRTVRESSVGESGVWSPKTEDSQTEDSPTHDCP